MLSKASVLSRGFVLACLIALAIGASHQASSAASDDAGQLGEGHLSGQASVSVAERSELQTPGAISRARTREILIAFYHATGGKNWDNSSNWLTTKPIRTWYGVTTTSAGAIEKLVLPDNGLSGDIPDELGELTSLRKLDLGFNRLTGAIPPELGSLADLFHLHLGSNQLIGSIPPELGDIADLESLDLFDNNLTGTIPPELALPLRLQLLRLDGNLLTGAIPATLGQPARLRVLRLDHNRLTGAIPPEIGNALRLATLRLDHNILSGPIPPEIGDLDRLLDLQLVYKQKNGAIPPKFSKRTMLRTLFLGFNDLSGRLPPELGNIPRMHQFTVDHNNLSGPIPPQLHVWDDLRWMWVRGTQLSGCIPEHWGEIAYHDFAAIGLGFCGFGLPHLDAGPGSLDPPYDPVVREFHLRVGIDAQVITLRPFFGHAEVAITDDRGKPVLDSDPTDTGYQIRLPSHESRNSFSVEYSQGSQSATYIVNVIRRFPARITVLENEFLQAPMNDDLKQNIPDLEVDFGGEILHADFLSHYHRTGGLTRWGYPTSEVLVMEPNSLTQFYQRGVVDFHNLGEGWVVERRLAWDYVGGGLAGSPDLGVEAGITNSNPGTLLRPRRHKVSNFAIDGTEIGFAEFFDELGGVEAFGFPKTDARVDVAAPGRVRNPSTTPGFIRQYFQAAVLEFHPNEAEPVKLSLLGDTLRNRLVPNHSALAAFAQAGAIAPGSEYVPWLATSYGDPAVDPQPATVDEGPATAAELEALVAGNSEFAFELYDHLAAGPENLIYSPYSISLAFAMALAGASGDTETQLRDVFRFPADQARLHPAFFALGNAISGDRPPGVAPVEGEFELGIANSLWLQKDFDFVEEYLDLLAEHYGAAPNLVDFMANHEAARIQINDWVAGKTGDRIMDLLQPGVLDMFTRLVLVNAIYFKAGWEYPFVDGFTRQLPFYLLDGSPVPVDLMNVSAPFNYWRGDGLLAVELPYKFSQQHMLLIVPDRGRYEEVEQSLSTGLLSQIDEGLEHQSLNLWFPTFEFESQLSLADSLKKLGAPDAFDLERAEFDRINRLSCLRGDRDCLAIKDAIHKAFIAVDEDGTEAAAATAIAFAVTASAGPRPQPIRVRIDRPFMFLIRDDATGAILFAGRVIDPR
ncbi:MAG: hypothetical protein F4Z80_00140 [Chloroflexi bacterium]|nr:hypothetical protein [Chloroflexota bacterium]